ncbi:MAG: hypothetical protein Q9212_004352 [Teloschistes hypoglaucus]
MAFRHLEFQSANPGEARVLLGSYLQHDLTSTLMHIPHNKIPRHTHHPLDSFHTDDIRMLEEDEIAHDDPSAMPISARCPSAIFEEEMAEAEHPDHEPDLAYDQAGADIGSQSPVDMVEEGKRRGHEDRINLLYRRVGATFRDLPFLKFKLAMSPSSLGPNQFDRPSTGPIRDEGIAASDIQIVNDDKSLGPIQNLKRTLNGIDRDTCFIIQVGDKVHPRYEEYPEPESGYPDTRLRIPVCKIVDKRAYRLSQIQKDKAKKNTGLTTKQIELNWAISQHDLGHRLDKLVGFLNQGRRVEVVFGKKRKGWTQRKDVTDEEAQALLHQIREAVKTVENSKEWQSMEGHARSQAIMFFEAKKK